MYAIDGTVPAEVLRATVQWLGRNPSHLSRDIASTCERKSPSIARAAKQFGIKRAALAAVIEGRALITLALARRPAAAGWSRAKRWLWMQSDYDRARARRSIKRTCNGDHRLRGIAHAPSKSTTSPSFVRERSGIVVYRFVGPAKNRSPRCCLTASPRGEPAKAGRDHGLVGDLGLGGLEMDAVGA